MSNKRLDRRTTRQLEAKERNAAWAALHYTTQLDRLHRRPGFSRRQRERIMAPTTEKIREKAESRNAA
jgi:hypothetical protein